MATNRAFGDRIGVSESMASRIRNGHRLPSVHSLGAIHRELGIPLDELHRAYERGHAAFGALISSVLQDRQAA